MKKACLTILAILTLIDCTKSIISICTSQSLKDEVSSIKENTWIKAEVHEIAETRYNTKLTESTASTKRGSTAKLTIKLNQLISTLTAKIPLWPYTGEVSNFQSCSTR